MKKSKLFIALLRMVVGWLFLYQGISAILQPGWSILPFIDHAQTFPHFYASLSTPSIVPLLSRVVEGLYVVVGVLLLLGIGTRLAALLGILVELFFYFPLLHFPHVGTSYYIIDEHILTCLILIYFVFARKKHQSSGISHIFKRSRY